MALIVACAGPLFQNYTAEVPAYYAAQKEAYMQQVRSQLLACAASACS